MRTDNEDNDQLLKDGEVRRVSLTMRDSRDAWRDDMAQHFGTPRFDDGLRHRPGFYQADEASLDRKEAAYREIEARDRDAWKGNLIVSTDTLKKDAADTSAPKRDEWGGKVGAGCTVNGAPGHLKMVNGKLDCVPDKRQDAVPPPTGDAQLDGAYAAAAAIEDAKERAYELRRLEDENAWRRS